MSEQTIRLPKFLTATVATRAVDDVVSLLLSKPESQLAQLIQEDCDFCIVVLVPCLTKTKREGKPFWEKSTVPEIIYKNNFYSYSSGTRDNWTIPFDEIATCKAFQLWDEFNAGLSTMTPAHLLFSDDTPFWGGIKREGIVVACSGLAPHLDRAISGMIADLMIAFAQEAWEKSEDKEKGRHFLE